MTPDGDGAHIFLSEHGNVHGQHAVISVHYARRHVGNYDVSRQPREMQEDQFARARLLADEMMVRVGVPASEVMSDRWSVDQDADLIRAFPFLSTLLVAGMLPNDVIRELITALLETKTVRSEWNVPLVQDADSKPASSNGGAS